MTSIALILFVLPAVLITIFKKKPVVEKKPLYKINVEYSKKHKADRYIPLYLVRDFYWPINYDYATEEEAMELIEEHKEVEILRKQRKRVIYVN